MKTTKATLYRKIVLHSSLIHENILTIPTMGISPEPTQPEIIRSELIRNLGHQLLDILYDEDTFGMAGNNRSLADGHVLLDNALAIYKPGLPIMEDANRFTDVKHVINILQIYLDDTLHILPVPTEIVNLLDEAYSDQSVAINMEKLEKYRKRHENDPIITDRTLFILGTKNSTRLHKNKSAYQYKKGQHKLILPRGQVVLYETECPTVAALEEIQADCLIIDTWSLTPLPSIAKPGSSRLKLSCNILGITDDASRVDSPISIRDAVIQTGGNIMSGAGDMNLQTYIQTGGTMRTARLAVGTYLQQRGLNGAGETTITAAYHIGNGAECRTRHLRTASGAKLQIDDEGKFVEVESPDFSFENDYNAFQRYCLDFGKEIIKKLFQGEHEDWDEMHVLLRLWFYDFIKHQTIPSRRSTITDVYSTYQKYLSGAHRDGITGFGEYDHTFNNVASIIAFFYWLGDTAAFPNFSEIADLRDVTEAQRYAQERNHPHPLLILRSFTRSQAVVSPRNWNVKNGIWVKFDDDFDQSYNGAIQSIETGIYLLTSDENHKNDYIIQCKLAGIMSGGTLDGNASLQCSDGVIQYGDIGFKEGTRRVIDKDGKHGKIPFHRQISGIIKDSEEWCQMYEQQAGLIERTKIHADAYTMTNGRISDSAIDGNSITIHGGTVEQATLEGDTIVIDNCIIRGRVIIRYRGKEPLIGNNIIYKPYRGEASKYQTIQPNLILQKV